MRERDEEVTGTQSKQIELDRVAEQYKALHAERNRILIEWEETLESMQVQLHHS
jgi:coiled-coil domain-containing protein 39